MPELPEVETSRRGIEPWVKNQTIGRVIVRQPKLRWPVPERIQQLSGETVISVQRRAKYLLLELSSGWMIIHLGMSGSLRILSADTPAQKHDHVDVHFSNQKILRYTDPRRFGAWLWCEDLASSSVLAHLGPEPLSEQFNAEYFYKRSRNKKTPIKLWIMDNKQVVGVGNIYASESLFMSGISPDRTAGSLSEEECAKLTATIKAVLQRSIEQGGTTLRDFLQSDGKPGYFAQELSVYGRAGEACHQCGRTILSIKQGQRTTFFCPECQH